ncbi:MAG: TIM barrel protein [Pirellulales bacterium]
MPSRMYCSNRREFLGASLATAAGGAAIASAQPALAADWRAAGDHVKQSVVHWCFKPLSVEELARAAAGMGLKSVELVAPEEWSTLKKHGLVCAITPSHGFVRGLNDKAHHPECLDALRKAIAASGDAGFPNVITFSGMRGDISDAQGIANMVEGLKQVVGLAEQRQVTICIEMLNSRVAEEMKGHPGYQCDKLEWAAEVCDRVGSPRVKILFDIYHVQIMQGDVIARIRQFKDYLGHIHTAGVPGRNELDDTQELNYRPIIEALVEVGYNGYVGQEFIPKNPDALASLRAAAQLCDV